MINSEEIEVEEIQKDETVVQEVINVDDTPNIRTCIVNLENNIEF